MGQRVPHRDQQAVGVERLLQEIERAALGRFDRGGDGAVARDHHHLRLGIEVPEPAERLQPIEARHLHVEKDQVGPELGVHGDRLAARGGHPHHQILVLQHLLQGLPDPRLVIDDQDPMAHGRGAPNSVAPEGRIRISRTPGGIRIGTVLRVGSPSALETSFGTASRGMGKSGSGSDRTAHSACRGPTTRSGPAASTGSLARSATARGPVSSRGSRAVARPRADPDSIRRAAPPGGSPAGSGLRDRVRRRSSRQPPTR